MTSTASAKPPDPETHRIHPAVRRTARRNLMITAVLIGVSLTIGMLGFHFTAGYGLVESFSQAALLLGGEGPSGAYPNDPSRVFAGVYALYSGLAYILVTALLLAPVFSHVLKRHHIDC